jgi:hypothetical protein
MTYSEQPMTQFTSSATQSPTWRLPLHREIGNLLRLSETSGKACIQANHLHLSDLLAADWETAPYKFAPQVPLIERVLWRCGVNERGCWVYTGSRDDNDYGMVRQLGVNQRCHQVTYEALVERTPAGLVLDHLCRAHPCCNPEHIEAVTGLDNSYLRAFWPNGLSRVDFCSYGHAWTDENTYQRPDGAGRQCRACIKRRQAK